MDVCIKMVWIYEYTIRIKESYGFVVEESVTKDKLEEAGFGDKRFWGKRFCVSRFGGRTKRPSPYTKHYVKLVQNLTAIIYKIYITQTKDLLNRLVHPSYTHTIGKLLLYGYKRKAIINFTLTHIHRNEMKSWKYWLRKYFEWFAMLLLSRTFVYFCVLSFLRKKKYLPFIRFIYQ